MLSDLVEVQWQRRRRVRPIHVVAVVSAVVAATAMLFMFNEYGPRDSPVQDYRLLVADVDLRIGTPGLAAERGAAKAKVDIEAGELKLLTVGPQPEPSAAEKARAKWLKQRLGLVWVSRSAEVTPLHTAYVEAYNRVVQAEIERKHGKDFAERLMRGDKLGDLRAAEKNG
jgi:hypothetical protein